MKETFVTWIVRNEDGSEHELKHKENAENVAKIFHGKVFKKITIVEYFEENT